MRRWIAAALAALALTGCGGRPAAAGLAGTVNTDGSSSMADVMAVLQEAFRQEAPGVVVNYSGTGSGAGIQAALAGTCDIGLSSRALKESEEAAGAKGLVIALDAVAVVVHPDNPVRELTTEELAGLFTGEIANWRELGGPDAPVAAYGREAGSGTRSAFEEAVGVTDRCQYTNIYGSTGDVIGNVAGNPNAIGYASLASLGEGVAAVSIDGAACTEEAVRNGTYQLQRPFLFVIREEAELSEAARAFLAFAQSEAAGACLSRAGAIAPD